MDDFMIFVISLTLEVEVYICIAIAEWIKGVTSVHAAVRQRGVLDRQGKEVVVFFHLGSFHPGDNKTYLEPWTSLDTCNPFLPYAFVLLDGLVAVEPRDLGHGIGL